MPLFGDEAWHYYVGRHWGADANHIRVMGSTEPARLSILFWWRPLFEVLLAPAGMIGFDAWRLANLIVTSGVAPVGYLFLRATGVRSWISLIGAAILGIHPLFVTWGVVVFPDGLLFAAIVAALWAWAANRPLLSAAFTVAASWIKEVGLVLAGFLFLWALVSALRHKRARLWPITLDARTSAFALAALLSVIPLGFYIMHGGKPPGWNRGGDPEQVLDNVLYSPWFVVPVVAGLAWGRSRLTSGLALAYGAFWLYTHFVLGRELQAWYYLVPSGLAILSAVVTLDVALSRTKRSLADPVRIGAVVASILLSLVVTADVLMPAAASAKGPLVHPFTEQGPPSLLETVERQYARSRDNDIFDALARVPQGQSIFLVDFPWYNIYYPAGERASTVTYAYTGWFEASEGNLEGWAQAVERDANLTLFFVNFPEGPFHRALLGTYQDCTIYQNPSFVVIDGPACGGRTERLRAAWQQENADQAASV